MSEDNNITPIDPFRNFVAEKESQRKSPLTEAIQRHNISSHSFKKQYTHSFHIQIRT